MAAFRIASVARLVAPAAARLQVRNNTSWSPVYQLYKYVLLPPSSPQPIRAWAAAKAPAAPHLSHPAAHITGVIPARISRF